MKKKRKKKPLTFSQFMKTVFLPSLPETSALKIKGMNPATMYNPPYGPEDANGKQMPHIPFMKCVPPPWLTKLVEKHIDAAYKKGKDDGRQEKLQLVVMREHYRCGVPIDSASLSHMELVARLARGMGKGRIMMIRKLPDGHAITKLLPIM